MRQRDCASKARKKAIALWLLLIPVVACTGDEPPKSSIRDHWSFQPLRCPPLPRVQLNSADGRFNAIDLFIVDALEKKGLKLSQPADRITLIRRATFDLTGLPPTPEEVAAFVNDRSPDAYEQLIERLLASARYGERWARHWLDVAGYADSEGVLEEDRIRENAYRYRDYVIRSFNADKPYDRFLKEQLAGDELVDYRAASGFTPDIVDTLEATGFLRTAVDATRDDFQPRDFAEYLWRTLFDTEQIVGTAILGLTIQCAQCHDHKYEPISQRDYYRLQAIFAGAIRPNGHVLPTYRRVITVATAEEQRQAAEVNERVDAAVNEIDEKNAELINEYKSRHPKGKDASEDDLRKTFTDFAAKSDELKVARKNEDSKRITLPTIRALYDLDPTPPPTRVLKRGDPAQPGDEVDPGIPVILQRASGPLHVSIPAQGKSTGRRLALAEWLVQPRHPLTARVMVNRIWAHHFGEGLVSTVSNFGVSGSPPTHQALLDYLSVEFVRSGWSVKKLHRLIITSRTYRQASVHRATNPDPVSIDPENRFLWHVKPRRLDAESIRDAVLLAAGTLDSSMYGAPVPTETKPTGEVVPAGESEGGRRSVYQLVRRSRPQSFLQAFDAPIMEVNCTRRSGSTTVTQTLELINSEFFSSQAQHFAHRVLRECPPAGENYEDTILRAFQIALARSPTSTELASMRTFIKRQMAAYARSDNKVSLSRAFSDLCHVLISSNEFIYVD